MSELRYMSGRELVARRAEREQRLAWIAEQVARGELVIRQATAEERQRWGMPGAQERPRARRTRAARRQPEPA
jgi:hypothetical protein